MTLLLELFCGTKSYTREFLKIDNNRSITLDNRLETNPDICIDILKWDYKSIETPDFIWASPPCTTFTYQCGGKHRTKAHMAPKTSAGKLGDKYLLKTLEIIEYFMNLNPNLKYVIENPRAFMQFHTALQNYPKTTVCYCRYGHPFMKPTDLWNNFNFVGKMCKRGNKKCHHEKTLGSHGTRKRRGVQRASQNAKYTVPKDLCRDIIISII